MALRLFKSRDWRSPLQGALCLALLAGGPAAHAAAAKAVQAAKPKTSSGSYGETIPGHDISGVWMLKDYVASFASIDKRLLRDKDGKLAPTQPWAQKIYDEHVAGEKAGHTFVAPKTLCLPDGLPLMWWAAAYPVQIIQTHNEIIFLHELVRQFRIAYFDRPHIDDPDPTYYGDSVAHWEGDTLVIDNTGFNGKNVYDMIGMPQSTKAHIIEHITRPDHDTLKVLITIDDPGVFTKTWEREVTYKLQPRDIEVKEYICLEGNRNLVVNGMVTVDGKGGNAAPKTGD